MNILIAVYRWWIRFNLRVDRIMAVVTLILLAYMFLDIAFGERDFSWFVLLAAIVMGGLAILMYRRANKNLEAIEDGEDAASKADGDHGTGL